MRRILSLIRVHVAFTKANQYFLKFRKFNKREKIINELLISSQAGENSFNYDFMTLIKDYHFENVEFGREVKTETMYRKKIKVSQIFPFDNMLVW